MDILEVEKWAIVGVSFWSSFWQFYEFALTVRRKAYWVWINFGFGLMCLYWGLYYLRSAIGIGLGASHQVFVRTPLLITIAIIGMCATISSLRRHRSNK